MEEIQQTQVHQYPDGSSRVGVPPFPKTSPKEDEAAELRRVGEPPAPAPAPPTTNNVVTADQVETLPPPVTEPAPAPAPVPKGKK